MLENKTELKPVKSQLQTCEHKHRSDGGVLAKLDSSTSLSRSVIKVPWEGGGALLGPLAYICDLG